LLIIFVMADIPELRLVTNRFGDMSLVYGGRAYKLRYTANGRLKISVHYFAQQNKCYQNPTEGNVAGSQPGFWPPPPSYQAATGQQYYPPPNQPSGQTFYVPVTNITGQSLSKLQLLHIGTLSEVSNTALTIFIFLGVICFFPIGLLYLFCLPPSISYRCCNCGFEKL
ncbi:hypothetical protein T07_11820, partial [Trichinella nelsoni]